MRRPVARVAVALVLLGAGLGVPAAWARLCAAEADECVDMPCCRQPAEVSLRPPACCKPASTAPAGSLPPAAPPAGPDAAAPAALSSVATTPVIAPPVAEALPPAPRAHAPPSRLYLQLRSLLR